MLEIPILMYHEVVDLQEASLVAGKTQYSYVMMRPDFLAQVKYLRNNGFVTLSMNELFRILRDESINNVQRNKRYIALTFDDGYLGNYSNVFPILMEYGMRGNFFLITERIEREGMMTWHQIRKMADYGMTFGSHTMNHALLGALSINEVQNELVDSKKVIEDNIGKEVNCLSLPHGSFGHNYRGVAVEAGYQGGCTSSPGLNTVFSDLFFLKRMNIPGNGSLNLFVDICNKRKSVYEKVRIKKGIIRIMKLLIGESRYLSLYNRIFRVQDS